MTNTSSYYMHPNVVLIDSPISGRGLVANGFIKKGEIFWKDEQYINGGNRVCVLTRQEIRDKGPEMEMQFLHYAFQIDEDIFALRQNTDDNVDIAYYENHSCDPNTWFVSLTQMEFCRDVQPGEEITYDYATSETSEEVLIEACRCGTAACRKVIRGDDYKLEHVQKKYGIEHFLPYIQKRILNQKG